MKVDAAGGVDSQFSLSLLERELEIWVRVFCCLVVGFFFN